MICNAEDIAKILSYLLKDEGLEIMVKEIAERVAQEIIDRHEETYNHDGMEKPLTNVEREED
jgi:hypothetical protein